jgi:hypothetical protein
MLGTYKNGLRGTQDGSLYLLEEHAGITAKIEPPEDWTDPSEDVEVDVPER